MRTPRIFIFQIIALAVWTFIVVSSGYAAPFSFITMADSRGDDNGVNDAILSGIVDQIVNDTNASFVLFR